MQQAVRNYINDNWKFWIIAIVATLAVLILGGISDAHAKPVLQKTVDSVQFYHDEQANTWYMKYKDYVTDMEESFDDIKVVWHGTYRNQPIILIAGQQGSMCEQDFQLYWFKKDGEVKQAKGFGTCYAPNTTVKIEGQFVIINFGDFIKRVPLY